MKKFILNMALLLVAGSLTMSAAQRTRRPVAKQQKKEMMLQLYSIRDVLGNAELYAKNHVEVFKKLRQYGFTGVEAANYNDGKFYGVSPEQYKKDCEAAGLSPLSSHATYWLNETEINNHDFTKAMKWWDVAIAAHKAAGMKYIVAPSGPLPKTLKQAQALCDYHNAVGEKVRVAGMKYGFHTHSGEYKKVEGTPWIEYMMKHISPDNMFWQMDTYWCVMAQEAPCEWFAKFPGRCKLLHIKDHYVVGKSGMVNYEAIFRDAKTCGLEGYVVELEGTDGTIDSMEGVRQSAAYLLGKPWVKASYSSK
jgi:sugar phosphate isomerase/epimerase